MAGFASPFLVKDIHKMLNYLGIKNNIQLYVSKPDKRFNKSYIKHFIYINGYERVGKYLKFIGFKNPKNLKKLEMSPLRFEFLG